MATDNIERLHYYQRQYVGALDFDAQQAYHRDMRRRLNLAHHTWGIVSGLELQETPKPGTKAVDIYINPGMAIDGYGREIVLFMPTPLDVSLFQPHRTVTRKWTVCLKYYENYSQRPQSGYEQCDVPNQFGRVQENFRIILADPDPFRDNLSVAGNTVQAPLLDPSVPNPFPEDQPILPLSPPTSTSDLVIPYDESLPYQEFPVDDPATLQFAHWLIPLGDVMWDGSLQSLVHDDSVPSIYVNGRRYIGAVTSRLLAPARTLIVRDRSASTTLPFHTSIKLKNQPPSPPPKPDGVEMIVEGTLLVDRTLQVDGVLYAEDNIQVDGGALDFRDASGSSDGKGGMDSLFTITRKGTNTDTGIDLRLQIGKDKGGKNRFVVGTDTTNLFWVADNGSAQFAGPLDVKTNLTIEGILDFGNQPRQMINLWSSNDNKQQNGIGIVTSGGLATTYFRSSSEYWWFKGGAFTAGQGDPGSGAQVQLKLDLDGSLHFDNDSDANTRWRQMLNLSSTGYGIGVQASTLYYRSDFDFCWFKGGSHSNTQSDSGGGTLQMKLNTDGALEVFADSTGHIAFVSNTIINNQHVSVKLGKFAGPHGADSVYGSPNLWLDTDGSVVVKKGLHIPSTSGAAYFLPAAGYTPQNGDVVVLNSVGNVNTTATPNDRKVLGVVSTDPGFILEDQPLKQGGVYVALLGIVQCNVDNTVSIMPISVGDLLTTSNNPGFAQKVDGATPRGAVLGKAMEVVLANQQKPINILIMPS